jgi:hypothetical protein
VALRAQPLHRRRPAAQVRVVPRRLLVLLLAIIAIAVAVIYSASSGRKAPPALTAAAFQVRLPAARVTVLRGSPDVVAAGAARELFASAPVVVVAGGPPSVIATAAQAAERRSAPLLLATPLPKTQPRAGAAAARGLTALSPVTRAEIRALHARAVLAIGVSVRSVAAQLPGIRVVSSMRALPATTASAPLRDVALLIRPGRVSPATLAAIATAAAAGVRVIRVSHGDPRADPAAITALGATRPRRVLALGSSFGSVGVLAANVAVAETGVQLPGGGQILFPGHRIVALYGHPGTPALGALGQQSLTASIARIKHLAARYRPLSRVPVVPAFEIIATVAEGSPGPNGLYSYETPVALLRPWIRRATAAGLYVVLDLQPGRASLLAQAKGYQSLLRLPDVGLALDPEWKLQPGQKPLQQIGHVSIAEVNSVVRWLAALTWRYRLPQKLLVLHQFRLSMIQNEQRLDTRHGDLAIVIHMDGQGTPADKVQTWDAVTAAAPHGVFFGWKNFFVKDHPMLTPRQTMHRTPQPVMISYQ